MRKHDIITEAELRMLLGTDSDGDSASLGSDDRKLLHALVRNQLRQLHMIEELQSEIRMMRTAMESGRGARESAASLGLDPLPFMRAPADASDASFGAAGGGPAQQLQAQQDAPPASSSRKERFKRRSLWGKEEK